MLLLFLSLRNEPLAQLVEHLTFNQRVEGSNPSWLTISSLWPVGQAVKTPPFHGGNTGSNPVRVTNNFQKNVVKSKELGYNSSCRENFII